MTDNQFENQIRNEASEDVESVVEDHIYRSVEYVDKSPKKSNASTIALIGVFVVIALILISFFLPWYSGSIKLSTIYMNGDLYLTKVGYSTNFPGMAGTGTWDFSDLAQYKGIKPTMTEPIYITLYIVVASLITAVIMLISVLGISFNFGNPYRMRKLGIVFGIVTFVLALVACFYFMTALTGNMTDYEGNKIDSFWYSKSTTDFGPASAAAGPGYGWYIIILVGIIALVSSIFIFKKIDIKSLSEENIQITRKKKSMLGVLVAAVTIIVIISVLALFVFKVGQNESQEDISKFIGTWELDINNTTGYQEHYNITSEIWTFYENKTLNIATVYESGGSGYTRRPFSVKDGTLSFVFSSLNYDFSSDYNRLTLTDSNQKIILNKIQ